MDWWDSKTFIATGIHQAMILLWDLLIQSIYDTFYMVDLQGM